MVGENANSAFSFSLGAQGCQQGSFLQVNADWAATKEVSQLSAPLILNGATCRGESERVAKRQRSGTSSTALTEAPEEQCSDGTSEASAEEQCRAVPESADSMKAPAASCADSPPPTSTRECLKLARDVFPVFLLAGSGMVGAGLLLATVRKWPVFVEVREILILVPALLGLKGNLEMTLAARLSTHANLGHLDGSKQMYSIIVGNLSVVQCQAIVVGLLASIVAIAMQFATMGTFDARHALLLASSAVTAAGIASLSLAVVMVLLVLASHHCGVDPDNVAAPIAGMLGDCITLMLIANIAQFLWEHFKDDGSVQIALLLGYLILLPICARQAMQNEHAAKVLREGWTPVILAMMISSVGGLILKHADMRFPLLALFAPVTNGAGGNLAAVQASRISTDLHARGEPESVVEGDEESEAPSCIPPLDKHAGAGMTLVLLVVPGALIFVTAIVLIASRGAALPSPRFMILYIAAVLAQARMLVTASHILVHGLWRRGIDPDNGAIPYVTALGDVAGTAVLAIAFWLLQVMGGVPWAGALEVYIRDS